MASYFSAAVAQRGIGSPYTPEVEAAANTYGVDANLVRAVIAAESAWNPTALSSTGQSVGLMQVNAAAWGVSVADMLDPQLNTDLGTQILADQLARRGGALDLALAGYNAGTSRSDADLQARIAGNVNGVGTYVTTVLQYFAYYHQAPTPIISDTIDPATGQFIDTGTGWFQDLFAPAGSSTGEITTLDAGANDLSLMGGGIGVGVILIGVGALLWAMSR